MQTMPPDEHTDVMTMMTSQEENEIMKVDLMDESETTAATTATSSSSSTSVDEEEIREHMLDTFPFTELGLSKVLQFYQLYRLNEEKESLSLVPETNQIIEMSISKVFVLERSDEWFDLDQWKFLEAMACLLGRRASGGVHYSLEMIYNVVFDKNQADDHDHKNGDRKSLISSLLDLVYRLLLSSQHLLQKSMAPEKTEQQQLSNKNNDDVPKCWIQSLSDFIVSKGCGGQLSKDIWIDWVALTMPQICKILPTYFAYALSLTRNRSHSRCTPIMNLPTTQDESTFWNDTTKDTIPLSLSLMSSKFSSSSSALKRLYSSDIDGFSFHTFQQAILNYHGPTVMLIQSMNGGDVFGYYTNHPWKNSNKWQNHDVDSESEDEEQDSSFLFSIKPTLQVYRPLVEGCSPTITKKKRYNKYLYNPSNSRHRPGLLTGLSIGGISDTSPRIHIPISFEQCKASSFDTTYQSGPLLSNNEIYFDIDIIEVWSITSNQNEYDKCIQKGKESAAINESNRIKAAKVDKKQFLDDFQSGQYINTIFTHREQVRGRHSFCADDDEGKGYFLEDHPPTPKEQSSKNRIKRSREVTRESQEKK